MCTLNAETTGDTVVTKQWEYLLALEWRIGVGALERVGPKWEESAQKEGERGDMEEWPSAVWITGLHEGGGVSLPGSLSYPGACNHEKLKPAGPVTPEGDAHLPSTETVKQLQVVTCRGQWRSKQGGPTQPGIPKCRPHRMLLQLRGLLCAGSMADKGSASEEHGTMR